MVGGDHRPIVTWLRSGFLLEGETKTGRSALLCLWQRKSRGAYFLGVIGLLRILLKTTRTAQ